MKQGKFEFAKVPVWAKISYALSGLLIILGLFNAREIYQVETYLEELQIRQDMYSEEIGIIGDKVDLMIGICVSYYNLSDNVFCLALILYHEARGETLEGMTAVGNVTMNRVASNRFPNQVCAVVFQGKHRTNWRDEQVPTRNACHFSWYCDGKSDEPKDYKAWATSVMLAHMLLTNTKDLDITFGATHYHSVGVKPTWCKDMKPMGTIGNHVFYFEL